MLYIWRKDHVRSVQVSSEVRSEKPLFHHSKKTTTHGFLSRWEWAQSGFVPCKRPGILSAWAAVSSGGNATSDEGGVAATETRSCAISAENVRRCCACVPFSRFGTEPGKIWSKMWLECLHPGSLPCCFPMFTAVISSTLERLKTHTAKGKLSMGMGSTVNY